MGSASGIPAPPNQAADYRYQGDTQVIYYRVCIWHTSSSTPGCRLPLSRWESSIYFSTIGSASGIPATPHRAADYCYKGETLVMYCSTEGSASGIPAPPHRAADYCHQGETQVIYYSIAGSASGKPAPPHWAAYYRTHGEVVHAVQCRAVPCIAVQCCVLYCTIADRCPILFNRLFILRTFVPCIYRTITVIGFWGYIGPRNTFF